MRTKIDSGVPCPPKVNAHESAWYELVYRMGGGDSCLVESRAQANALAFVIRYHGGRATVRKQESGKYRVWKLGNGK